MPRPPVIRRPLATLLFLAVAAAACAKDSATTTDTDPGSSGGSTVGPPVSDTGDPSTQGPTTLDPTTTGTTGPGDTPTTEEPDPGTVTGDPQTSTDPATGTTGPGGVPMPVDCGGMIYQCGDALDNDGDGKFDGGDPECTSPCDDNEGSFQTDLPGQNKDCLADCYWDGNSGQGNDLCVWNLKCDPENPGAEINCAYDPDKKDCDVMQPQACVDFCASLTPNGCDCFGCCIVDTPNGAVTIYLGGDPECSLSNLEACGTCTFQPGCNNDCNPDACELCFGEDELPPGCDMPECGDKQPCMVDDVGNSDCPEDQFCSTGCCRPIEPG